MLSSPWFWTVLALMPVAGAALYYNALIKYRNRLREAWSGIDVQLKRRHDLIPRLVDAVKGYTHHEHQLLEDVTRVRTEGVDAGDMGAAEDAEQKISRSLRPLLALVEAYPDLKADGAFAQLQAELVEVEDVLQMARRYYNGTVRDHNNLVEMFPGNLIAGLLNFKSREFFEIETATERLAPRVNLSKEGEGTVD